MLARSYSYMKQYDKAVIDLSKAIELKGESVPASYFSKLGLAYYWAY